MVAKQGHLLLESICAAVLSWAHPVERRVARTVNICLLQAWTLTLGTFCLLRPMHLSNKQLHSNCKLLSSFKERQQPDIWRGASPSFPAGRAAPAPLTTPMRSPRPYSPVRCFLPSSLRSTERRRPFSTMYVQSDLSPCLQAKQPSTSVKKTSLLGKCFEVLS